MEAGLGEFCRALPALRLSVLAVKKIYLTKYILFVLEGEDGAQHCLEKKTEDLRPVYKRLRALYPNFPLSPNHGDNLARALAFAAEEVAAGRPEVAEELHAFLHKAKNQSVLTKEYFKEQGKSAASRGADGEAEPMRAPSAVFSLSGLPAEGESLLSLEASFIAEPGRLSRPGGESLGEKVLRKLFVRSGDTRQTNYQRMLLQEKLLAQLDQPALSQDLFPVELRLAGAPPQSLFAKFADCAVYLYEEKRHFLADKDSYRAFLLLVKVEQFRVTVRGEAAAVELGDAAGETLIEFGLRAELADLFSLLLVCETVRRDSPLLEAKRLPEPLNALGYLALALERLPGPAVEDGPAAVVRNSFFQLSLPRSGGAKLLLLPVMNVFEVIELTEGAGYCRLETLALAPLPLGVWGRAGELGSYTVSALRLFDYLRAYLQPPLENYQESRFQSGSISSGLRELQAASFRLKRLLAHRDQVGRALAEFWAFKYPAFTQVVLALTMAVAIVFGLGVLLLLAAAALVLYFHPAVQPRATRLLLRHAFTPQRINRHYRGPRLPTEKERRKVFHLDLNNIERSSGSSTSFTGKLQEASGLAARVPAELHFIADCYDKAKNLLLWRDHRKTQLFLAMLCGGGLLANLLGKEVLYVLFCLGCYACESGYYARVDRWNREVLDFLVRYFVQHESPLFEGSAEEFFQASHADPQARLAFSRRFAEFVLKYVDIRTDETYWVERFSVAQIVDELHFSTKRLVVPFYERRRRPNARYLSYFFLFSTPSDFYYHSLSGPREEEE